MEKNHGTGKRPVTQERIFMIMMVLTFGVSSIFLIKNLLGGNRQAMFIIGGCLLVFAGLAVVMHLMKMSQYVKQFIMSICLVVLVFVISANSGDFYSDDFPLFLAVIGLSGIEEETHDLERTFVTVRRDIQATGSRINDLDEGLMGVEQALTESSANLTQMKQQMEQVRSAVISTGEVFAQLREQTKEIGKLADEMQNIAFNTTILALNASVEAARAGEYGVGFTVVANEVQRLAAKSESCTDRVSDVMAQINLKLEQTARRMEESAHIIESSHGTMHTMEEDFHNLEEHFEGLHQNIAGQNESIRQVDGKFDQLEARVSEMNSCSAANQQVVEAIVSAIKDYQHHMELIVSDSQQLQKLSASMMDGFAGERSAGF